MQKTIVLFFLLNALTANALPLKRGIYTYPDSRFRVVEKSNESSQELTEIKFNSLERIKFLIISGNLDYAKVLLKEANLAVDFSKPVQLRYLAMIYFIEGRYRLVVDTLKNVEMRSLVAQPRICMLRTLSYIVLDKPGKAKAAWNLCNESTLSYSENSLIWMRILVGLKTSKDPNFIDKLFKGLSIDNIDKGRLRIYLKLALYLNKQDKILPRLKFLNKEVLEDDILRELIGFNYFRAGDITKAYSLIENLETADSEIFKGNIYSFQKRYNEAYAKFALDAQRVNDAFERAGVPTPKAPPSSRRRQFR